jgi:hypothetical protein
MRWLACRTRPEARFPEYLPRGIELELGEQLALGCQFHISSNREEAVKAGGFLAGRPEDIIEALKPVEKRYPGHDRVTCATPLGTPLDVQLRDLRPFRKRGDSRLPRHPTAAAAQ